MMKMSYCGYDSQSIPKDVSKTSRIQRTFERMNLASRGMNEPPKVNFHQRLILTKVLDMVKDFQVT